METKNGDEDEYADRNKAKEDYDMDALWEKGNR